MDMKAAGVPYVSQRGGSSYFCLTVLPCGTGWRLSEYCISDCRLMLRSTGLLGISADGQNCGGREHLLTIIRCIGDLKSIIIS
jgi:hypothetical protein